MSASNRPSLLFVAYDARDLEAARVTLEAGGWLVTAAVSAAHAMRLLEQRESLDAVAIDPRAPGAMELVASLGQKRARVALFFRVDAEAAADARAERDRGVIGCGSVTKLAALASAPRPGDGHVVTFTTVLRVAWFARATVAVRVTVTEAGDLPPEQVVLWLEKGEPVDAAYKTIRGVDAVSRLVPGSVLAGPGSDVLTTACVVEYETTPGGVSIRCGMPTLLDLFDDDAPTIEVAYEEIDTRLWTDVGWSSQPPPDDPFVTDLTTRAAAVDGVLEVVVLDGAGTVAASIGASEMSSARAVELWSVLAAAVATATPDDRIEEVVLACGDVIDVLAPLHDDVRVLHVRFARRHTNLVLASREVRGVIDGRTATAPDRQRASSSSSSRSMTP